MGQSIVSCFFDFVKYLQKILQRKNSVFDFVVSMHEEDLYTDRHKVDLAVWLSAGPDLGGGKLGSCPGPPTTKGLHKNSKKIPIT